MKRSVLIFLCSVVTIVSITTVFCFHGNMTTAQSLDNNINGMMEYIDQGANMDFKTQLSSNPYDYAKNNKYFTNIVNMGFPVLPLLDDYITKSEDNGLKEYLLAIAFESIARVNLKVNEKGDEFQWETGKGFIKVWKNHLIVVPNELETTLESNTDDKDKVASLANLGLAVVPFIIDRFDQCNLDQQQVLTTTLKFLLADNYQAIFNSENINDAQIWIIKNATKFSEFKQYITNKSLN